MTWVDRLAKSVEFTSPNGRNFSAKWSGSDRSMEKKLGVFNPPRITGTNYQDLRMGAIKYPMTIIIDGENHDLEAALFFEAAKEEGTWEVIHPIHGSKNLLMIAIVEKDQPVSNGNYTEFDLDFVEPLDETLLRSSAGLAEEIQAKLIEANQRMAEQLALANQDTASRIQAIKNAAQAGIDLITDGLASISNLSADIARITNEIQRATTSQLLNPTVALSSLATQIQVASQTPALASDNVSTRLGQWTNLGETFFGNNPTTANLETKNTLLVKELILNSLAGAMPLIVSTGPISSRSDAITFGETLIKFFDDMTNDLDAGQELFEGTTLDVQYFSNSSSYATLLLLFSLGLEYLKETFFSLKIEKRFRLKKPRSPIEITITEYGELGEDDINLDLFIASNNLSGKDILLLPAGREVVVYV